jgi:hypothetical protein
MCRLRHIHDPVLSSLKMEGIRLHFFISFNLGAIWGWVVNATPRPLYPREGPIIFRRIGGPQVRSGQVRKIPPPPPTGV